MTYYGAKDLANSFRTVRKNTVLTAEDIPEEKYSFRAAAEVRSVAETLTHIALISGMAERIHAIEKQTTLEGFDFLGLITQMWAKEKEPRSKAQVIQLLRGEGDRFGSWLEGVSDEFLAQRVTRPPGMAPPSKTRFEMLLGVKEHEMHHRGQLMVVERMLGIVPHLTRDMQARMAQAQRASGS